MEVKIIKDEKNELELEVNHQTIVEILRVYLKNDSSVEFVAWKREHPTKGHILKIKTKGKTAKKALQDAVSAIEKDTGKYLGEFKKAK